MPAAQIPVDVSTFDLDTFSMLTTVRNATLEFQGGEADGSIMTRYGRVNQVAKKSATLRFSALSLPATPAGATKVTNLSVSAFTADAMAYIGLMRSASIEFTYQHDEASGLADVWTYPVLVSRDIRIRGTMVVPSSMTATLLALTGVLTQAYAATVADLRMTVTVTIDGTSFTLPMVLTRCAHVFEDGRAATFEVEFAGEDPGTGTYPTAPTGTASLLAYCVTSAPTALVLDLVSKATAGATYAGGFLVSRVSIDMSDSAVVTTDYEFVSQGAVTVA